MFRNSSGFLLTSGTNSLAKPSMNFMYSSALLLLKTVASIMHKNEQAFGLSRTWNAILMAWCSTLPNDPSITVTYIKIYHFTIGNDEQEALDSG